MDYQLYDQLQAQLGCVSDSYQLRCEKVLESSAADEQTKKLCADLCEETRKSLNALAEMIAETLIAASK